MMLLEGQKQSNILLFYTMMQTKFKVSPNLWIWPEEGDMVTFIQTENLDELLQLFDLF